LSEHAERALSAERARPMRVRVLVIVAIDLAIWLLQFLLFESEIFPSRRDSFVFRGLQLASHLPVAIFLLKARPAEQIERALVGLFLVWAPTAAYGLQVCGPSCVVPFTLTFEWATIAMVFGSQISFAPASIVLALTWLSGVVGTLLRAHFDTDLSDHVVLLGVYGVCLASVWSIDRLRRREFVMRHRLDEANTALRKAEEVRGRLFVNISHDFRTPLALIHSEAEALERDGSPPERGPGLERIRRHAQALADLTNELLELARLEAGKTPCSPSDFDVRELLEEVGAQMSGPDQGRVQVAAGDHLPVRADVGHVRRIVANLVANALRYAKGSAAVRLKASRVEGGHVVIDVEDDGPGVSPDKRAAIFERFASFDAAGSLASGIGLPVARELAELNGGSLVLLDGAPCTTFRLRLPAAIGPVVVTERPQAPRVLAEPAPGDVAIPASAPAALPSVLVVEDHPEMRRLLGRLLVDKFRVLEAGDCAAARQALAFEAPAAVVCDVMLPDGTGYEVLDHLRGKRAFDGVPLLFLSALSDDDQRVRGIVAGAEDYVAKPFSSAELVARVEAACKRAEERRQALEAQRLDFTAELHDGVSAALSRAAALLSGSAKAERVAAAQVAVKEALDEIRTILSLVDGDAEPWADFVRETRTELGALAAPFRLSFAFEADSDGTVRTVSSVLRHTLRRVGVEALTNVIKHAGAERVSCRVAAQDGVVRVRVEDDGVGIRSASGGRGLAIARRRAERLGGTLQAGPLGQRGTCIEASVPGALAVEAARGRMVRPSAAREGSAAHDA
jgi:signal transduction histidine kinase